MNWTRGVALFASLAGAACGSSPEPIYYAMAPTRGTPGPGWAHLVEVRRPALAGYLDRAGVVRRGRSYRVRVAADEDWSEPLDAMIGRVLVEDLAQRLPGSVVFAEPSAISVDPDAIVSVNIQQFDAGPEDDVTFLAEIMVQKPGSHAATASRRVDLHQHVVGVTTGDLVGAMSALVGRTADLVASDLRGTMPAAKEPR